MKKLIIAVSVLLSLGTVPAMADKAHHAGKSATMDSQSDLTVSEAYGHVSAAAQADFEKCAGYAAGRDGVYPYECAVGTRGNGSEGGSDGDSGASN